LNFTNNSNNIYTQVVKNLVSGIQSWMIPISDQFVEISYWCICSLWCCLSTTFVIIFLFAETGSSSIPKRRHSACATLRSAKTASFPKKFCTLCSWPTFCPYCSELELGVWTYIILLLNVHRKMTFFLPKVSRGNYFGRHKVADNNPHRLKLVNSVIAA